MDTTQYFYRNAVYSKEGRIISLVDIYDSKKEPQELEPWFAMVFNLADGQHSVDELIELLSKGYNGAPPANLRETVTSVVERMIESKLIVLTEEPTPLPYYLSAPVEQLDVERAKKLLQEDRADVN